MLPANASPAAAYQHFARNGYAGNAVIFAAIDLVATSASEPHIIGRRWRRNRRGSSVANRAWDTAVVDAAAARQQVASERRLLAAHGLPNRAGARMQDALLVRNGFFEEVTEHPLVHLLNNPNPYVTRAYLYSMLTVDLHLAGNAYLLKARYRSGLLEGAVGELWRLRPDRVRVVPGDTTKGEAFIKAYEYGVGNDKVTYDVQDILHFKTRNPFDAYYGMPPLMSVIGRIAIDNYMQDFLRDFYDNGGAGPGSILSFKNSVRPEVMTSMKERFRQLFGRGRFHEMLVFDNSDGMTYQQLGLNRGLRDALPKEIDAVSEARLSMVIGVPGSVLGLLIGYESSSYANKRSDWQTLWDIKMTPMLSDFNDVLNLGLTPEFSGIDEVCFDLSDIRALQEDVDAIHKRARDNVDAGLWTIEYGRLFTGVDAVPPDGEHVLLPTRSTIVATPLPDGPPENPPPLAVPPAQNRFGRPRIEDDAEAKADYAKALEFKSRYPDMTWRQIADRIGRSERQLREIRSRFDDDEDD